MLLAWVLYLQVKNSLISFLWRPSLPGQKSWLLTDKLNTYQVQALTFFLIYINFWLFIAAVDKHQDFTNSDQSLRV